jgi:hypothetical protein
MCRFSSGNWFFNTKVAQLAVSGEMLNTQLCTSKKECNKLDLTANVFLIGPGGLLLIIPYVYTVPVLLVGFAKTKTVKT